MICNILKTIFEKFDEEYKNKAEILKQELEVIKIVKEINSALDIRTKEIAKLKMMVDNL